MPIYFKIKFKQSKILNVLIQIGFKQEIKKKIQDN